MTTIDSPASAAPAASGGPRVLAGIAAWTTSSDHKQIGRLMAGLGLLVAIAVAVVGLLLGLERIDPDGFQILSADAVERLSTAMQVGLAFGAVLPLLLGIAVAVVPLQVGARSLSMPRVAALGVWTWLVGLGLVIYSLAGNGGPGGSRADLVDLYVAGLAVVAIGLTLVAGSLVVTMLTNRAPGMTLARVPALAWSALVGGVAVVISLPVLVGNAVYLFVDGRNAEVAFGGADGLTQWTGWAFSQPQTLVWALVAVGVAADVIVTVGRTRHPLRPVLATGIGLVALAALAGVTQLPHRVAWEGDGFFDNAGSKVADLLPYAFFNALPVLGILVTLAISLLVFKIGSPRPTGALTFVVLGLGMILAGGAGNLLERLDGLELAGTSFTEAAFVYVGYGAVIVALGALAHWGPKLWGRRLPDPALHLLALGAFGATVVACLPLYVAGFLDDPADVFFVLSAIGHALMALVLVGFTLLALRGFSAGPAAGDDPFDGQTLEWAVSSPPPPNNFTEMPTVVSAEPLFDLKFSGGER